MPFGSKGHAKSSTWTGLGLAYLFDYNNTLEAIHKARMATKEDNYASTILMANHQDWSSQTNFHSTNKLTPT